MKKFALTWILAVSTTIIAFSQSVLPAKNLQVYMKPVDAQGNAIVSRDRDAMTGENATLEVTYAVEMADINGVAAFQLKLGTTEGGSEKASVTIPFDGDASQLPQGVKYNRDGNVVYITLGVYSGIATYYAEVKLKDASGNLSDAVESSTL